MTATPIPCRIYYLSDRPEAYEYWGEIGHDAARRIGLLAAGRASERFPDIEFRVDSQWHEHQNGMDEVSAFIDDHLPDWVSEATAAASG